MKLSGRHIIYYRMLLCLSLIMITYLATTALEVSFVSSNYDKINHIAAFLTLAFLMDFSFPNSRFNSAKIFTLITYGFLLEIVQYFLPHRIFSLFDLGADCLGLILYGLLIPLIKRLPVLSDRWVN